MLKDSSLPCRNSIDFLNDSDFLQQAAISSGFFKRKARKLTPQGFLKAVLHATANALTSFASIALHTGDGNAVPCSPQNIFKRCGAPAVDFMRKMLDHAISFTAPALPGPQAAAFFKRIIIQDGSLIRFHDSACTHFPAVSSTTEDKAMLRLQFAYDYKSGRILFATPAAYSHTDAAASADTLDWLEPGDLCLRDMGYYKAELFGKMDAKGVFYLSRLKPEVKIPQEDGQPAIGLDEFLRGASGPVFDKTIRVGAKRDFITRVVAVRVPEKVAAERRRKLHAEAKRRNKAPSALKFALTDWTVFVTNIPREMAGPEDPHKLYGLRWHVELVFKALKGNGCMRALTTHASNPHHLEVLLLAQLLQIVLNLRLWRMLSPATKGVPRLSLLKIAALMRETLAALWPEGPYTKPWEKHMRTLLRRCCYDKRRKRRNLDEIWEDGLNSLS
ncbi:IS4 family transposase [Luteolibacter sp. Populi]|uniref:IS4 family transposase n=1 Tax=Luteolibacter sp. Populi TaxID=3230487 RepID=UPI003466C9BF